MLTWLTEAVQAVFTAGGSLIKGWADRKKLEAETKSQVAVLQAQAEVKRAETQQQQEGDWDTEAVKQTKHSWKDEYFAIILSLPFLGSFIPVVQDYVVVGWTYLDKAPEWYQWCFVGGVVASFGIRWSLKFWSKT